MMRHSPPPDRTVRDSCPSYGSSFFISYVISSLSLSENICALKTLVRLASVTKEERGSKGATYIYCCAPS
jgi:hypothetical protein